MMQITVFNGGDIEPILENRCLTYNAQNVFKCANTKYLFNITIHFLSVHLK